MNYKIFISKRMLAEVAKQICQNMPNWTPAINAYNEPVRHEAVAVVPFELDYWDIYKSDFKEQSTQEPRVNSSESWKNAPNNGSKKKRSKADDDMYF